MFNWLDERFGVNKTVFALSTARLGDAVGNSILFVVLPLYVNKLPSPVVSFGESARVGILLAIYGLVAGAIEPALGSFIDRIGRRKILIIAGLVISAVATFAFVFANEFMWLVGLRLVQGIGFAITTPAEMTLIALVTREQTRGRAMGFLTTMRMLGFALGPVLGGFLLSRFGFNSTFYVGAGSILLTVLLVQWWVHEPENSKHPKRQGSDISFFDRRLWNGGVLAACLATMAMAVAFTVMAPLEKQFNRRLNEGAFLFGVAFAALTVTRLITQMPLGWLSDWWRRKPVIIIGLAVMAPATVWLGFVSSTFQLCVARAIQGAASGAVAAPALALAADSSRIGGTGRQMSVAIVGFSFGLAIGPLMAGFLAPVFFSLPFLIAGAMNIAAIVGVWYLAPRQVTGKTAAA